MNKMKKNTLSKISGGIKGLFDSDPEKIEFVPKKQWKVVIFVFVLFVVSVIFLYVVLFFSESAGLAGDVGVDNNNFFPLSFEEIKEIMAKRPDNPNFIKEEDRRKVELK